MTPLWGAPHDPTPHGVTHSLSHRGPPTTPQWGPPSPRGVTLYLQPDEARPRVWRQHCSHVSEQLRAVQRPSGAQHHRRHPCAALVAFRGVGGDRADWGARLCMGGAVGRGVPGTVTPYTVASCSAACASSASATSVVATFSPFHLRGPTVLCSGAVGPMGLWVLWGCGSHRAVGPIGLRVP